MASFTLACSYAHPWLPTFFASSSASSSYHLKHLSFSNSFKTYFSIPISISISANTTTNNGVSRRPIYRAAKQQSSSSVKKRVAPEKKRGASKRVIGNDEDGGIDAGGEKNSSFYQTSPLPKPPAGFVVDAQGRVVMASSKRIATIVDSLNNLPLKCVIRRVFRSSQGDECMLLCPVDTPVQILKSTNADGWAAVSDEEVEALLPAASYALAKIHMHLVVSGFCYTARGGFCYSEEDIFEFGTDDNQELEGLPAEGVEITCFNQDGIHYMIYTPSDPLLFVAVKDHNGHLQIANDDLLEDPTIVGTIDEETEFNALVEEEAALLESLLGKRLDLP